MMIGYKGSGANINPGLPWYGLHRCGTSTNGNLQSIQQLQLIRYFHLWLESSPPGGRWCGLWGKIGQSWHLWGSLQRLGSWRQGRLQWRHHHHLHRQVGEWVSEVILGDAQGGMRLVYHSSGESSRWLKDISSPKNIGSPIHVWPFASICVRGMRKNGRTDVIIYVLVGKIMSKGG